MIKKPERRSPLYLLTGLVLGLVLGALLAWLVLPARVTNVSPANLADEYKSQYRLMVAIAYAATGDIGRAEARIALLGEAAPARILVSEAQIFLANSETQREARALAGLAAALEAHQASQQSTAVAVNTPNPEAGELATPYQTTAQNARYHLSSQELLCENTDSPPLLKLFIFDEKQNAQAGVRIGLSSSEGVTEFFTGAQPEFGPGYADYQMTPGVQYTLSIQGSEMMGGLQAAACETEEGEPAWGSWLLLFNAEE